MDPSRFDSLSRALASAKSRRGFLGSLAVLGAGLFGARAAGAQEVSQAFCGNKTCKNNPGKCTSGCVCCTWSNGNSRCMPPGKCPSAAAPTTTTTTTSTTTTTTTACPTVMCGSVCCPPESPACTPAGTCVECAGHADCDTDPERPYCDYSGEIFACVSCLPGLTLCTSDEQCCTRNCDVFTCTSL